jgi:hypothetical protein
MEPARKAPMRPSKPKEPAMPTEPTAARKAFGHIAPPLADLTDKVLFGDV